MKHLQLIQSEFLKFASWDDLSLQSQKDYLQRHPNSKRKITAPSMEINKQNKTFSTNDGIINFSDVTSDQRYEFTDENNPFWNKADKWLEIDTLRANEKFKGKGSILLNQFIKSLPNNTGIVLNATPLDDDISFENLQNWYKKHGFKQINKDNISLYFIKG